MKRRLIIIVASFVLIIGISIGGFLIVQGSPKLQNTVAKLANVPSTTIHTTTSETNTPIVDQFHLPELKSVARIFAERYGSTSNQDPSSLSAVVPYSSQRLATILQANITQLEARAKPEVALTVTTKSYVITPSAVSATSATVTVGTIREEVVGSASEKKTKQDVVLQAIRENGAWKIDQAEWGTATAYGN